MLIAMSVSEIVDNVRQELIKLLPASIINETVCFVFYDNHPRDNKLIDIIVCTKFGEVREYYQRDLVASVSLDIEPKEIKILRNSNSDLFYLVANEDVIFILCHHSKLEVRRKIINVDSYAIEDFGCRGQACLKVICKEDAVPLVYDENFENLFDRAVMFSGVHADDTFPILTQLMRKLTESRFNVKCNEKTLENFINLRRTSAYSMYQRLNPNTDKSNFKSDLTKNVASLLKIKSQIPWIKMCNNKLVIVLNTVNQNEEPIEDVHIYLHGISSPSVVYSTKLFQKMSNSPCWREKSTQKMKPNQETAIVAVIDVDEIKYRPTSRIDLNGVIAYKKMGKEQLIPFESVHISSLDAMIEEFDVLSGGQLDDPNAILAVLATTEKNNLILRHIKGSQEQTTPILNLFCSYLKMDKVANTEDMVIFKKSPYHTLNGCMILLDEKNNDFHKSYVMTVYSRSSAQTLSLIHLIYDTIPVKLLITAEDKRIMAIKEELNSYNEESYKASPQVNCLNYASSMVNQASIILEYLDNSMIKMNESKSQIVQSKIGKEIDMFAGGLASYMDFRNRLLEEGLKGIKRFNDETQSDAESAAMIID